MSSVGFSYAQVNLQQQRLKKKMMNSPHKSPVAQVAGNSKEKKKGQEKKVHPSGNVSSAKVSDSSIW
ncbi:hypothetical protein HanRHA438_Chr15g0691241 [Helianthus annuus]|nr:hypothetical protein HanRHA438_Chr15g0691241 [Helianthus annuus]